MMMMTQAEDQKLILYTVVPTSMNLSAALPLDVGAYFFQSARNAVRQYATGRTCLVNC